MTAKADPLFVERIAQIVTERLGRNLDADPEIMAIVGEAVANAVSEEFGGELVYVSKGWIAKARERHRQIYQEFNGSNVKALAKKHGISIVWCYEIIGRMRKEYVAERQRDIFDGAE